MKLSPRVKKMILFAHRWLGFITGLVLLIVALTGAIYCFAPELQDATQPYRFVQAQDRSFLPPSQIKSIAEKQLPGKPSQRICYGTKDRAAYVLFFGKEGYYYSVFINPYTGEVLKVKNMRRDFFTVVLYLHFTLLIPYGREIVNWCTLIFFFILITGIIMWWPRSKGARKSRFSVKWGASPKRLNYDLHNVLGFYASWIAIFMVITGLVWSFDWFANGLYRATGSKHSIIKKKAPLSDKNAAADTANFIAIDRVWQTVQQDMSSKYLAAQFLLPQSDTAAILVRANPEPGTYYRSDYRYFDQYTAREIPGAYVWGKYSDAHTLADKLKRMNYDIHVGAILGWPGRIAAFLGALIVASLPVTGFLIWRGRRKKKPKRELSRVNRERVAVEVTSS